MQTKIIKFSDDSFPEQLRHIYNPPEQLHLMGEIPLGPKVAIVGMRKNTPYGEKVVRELIPELTKVGIITVSGLAYGIDSLVHKYTLLSGGKTIAVLGAGLNNVYPTINRKMAEEIVSMGGALISEYEADEPPLQHHFPERNRIVAGLAQAVIVIEGAFKSGSLITAKIALEEGRDVWAVPGRIDLESSKGTNYLIDCGAIPYLEPNQFLSYYKLSPEDFSTKKIPANLTPKAKTFFEVVHSQDGESIDKYAVITKLDMSQVNTIITELELNNLITNKNGRIYLI